MLPKEFANFADADGRITRLPVKLGKKVALARWAGDLFELERVYSEREVNEIIGEYIEDFALIRRMLVVAGTLSRDAYGREYRRTS